MLMYLVRSNTLVMNLKTLLNVSDIGVFCVPPTIGSN